MTVEWPGPDVFAPAPQRRRTSRWAIVGSAILVVVVVAVSLTFVLQRAGATNKAAARSQASPHSYGTAGPGSAPLVWPSAAPIAPGDGSALAAHLAHVTDARPPTVLDLSEFSARFDNPGSATADFTDYGFKVAALDDWTASGGVAVHAELVQWADANGARSFMQARDHNYEADTALTNAYEIGGQEYAEGYLFDTPDDQGNRFIDVLYPDGPISISLVLTYGSGAPADWAAAVSALQDQVTALSR